MGVSPDTLYRYISDGVVPAFKLGNRWKLRKSILDRWMESKMESQTRPKRPGVSRTRKGAEAMFGGSKQKQLVGLDIGSSSIKAVELKNGRQGYELVSYGMEPLAQDTVVDGAIMDAPLVAAGISNIFERQKIKNKNVATSVSGHSVIVKPRVPLPLMTEEELYDRIQTEASQHIPFDIADVNLSYQHLDSVDSQMEVLLVAVKKDKILNHTNVLAQAGKTPSVVDIDAFALQNCFEITTIPIRPRPRRCSTSARA